MKKKVFMAMFVLCLCFVMLPLTVMAADTTAIVTTENELTEALADESKTIVKLTRDIDITATLEINREVALDLNGYVLKQTGNVSVIANYGNFTLRDSRANDTTAKHYFTVDESGLWKLSATETENVVYGGVITGSTGDGGVCNYGGAFIMEGGYIVGCTATNNGGGVNNSGSFTMEGGYIVGCTATHEGSGVCSSGIFTIKGGCIEGSVEIVTSDLFADGGAVMGDVYFSIDAFLRLSDDATSATVFCGGLTIYGTIFGSNNTIINNIVNFKLGDDTKAWEVIRSGGNAVDPSAYICDPGMTYKWYTDKELTTEWSFDTAVTGGMDLYGGEIVEGTPVSSLTQENLSTYMDGNALKAGNYIMNSDITVNSTIQINSTVILDLNGYVLKQPGSGSVIANNGNFTLRDSRANDTTAKHYFTVDESGLWKLSATETENVVYGGVIIGGSAEFGGGVSNNYGGTFIMEGGFIDGSVAIEASATLFADGGTVMGDLSLNGDSNLCQSDDTTSATVFYGGQQFSIYADIKGHHVEFFMDGARYAWERVRDGGNAVEPVDPTKTGYRFDGWFKDDTAWQFATATVNAPTVLSAKWSHIAHTGTASCNKVAECETCGEPFGTIDPNNHIALTKIKAVSPTYSKEGNIAYWYCSDCDKCFSDENATHEITHEQTIIPTLIYVEPIGPYAPNLALSISDSDNGSVTADLDRAKNGDIVTITVTPANGYAMKSLTVLDPLGREIPLTDKGNGHYRFTMPNSMVEIKASFAEIQQSTPVEPDETDKPITFNDLSRDAYYYDAVLWAVEQGITGGVGNGKFDPNGACTRAQIVTFIWRAAGCPDPKNMNSFDDVPSDAYYTKAVAWAIECGITSGVDSGKFDPNATCTRAQSVTFLYRALGSPATAFGISFGDVPNEAYYAKAVAWAAECGITGGTSAETFSPDSNCTRAQIVTFIWRAIAK